MRAFVILPAVVAALVCGVTACSQKSSVVQNVALSQPTRAPNGPPIEMAANSGGVLNAHYACNDGTSLDVAFDAPRSVATVTTPDGDKADLHKAADADGVRYRSSRYDLQGKGVNARFSDSGAGVDCRAIR